MSHSVIIRDLMTKNVANLSPDMTLEQAWNFLTSKKISGAPVAEKSGKLVGILSQTDLAREAFRKHGSPFSLSANHSMDSYFQTLEEGPLPDFFKKVQVENIMDQDVITAAASDSVGHVADKMRKNHIHRVVIVENEKVIGIVSALDLLTLLT